MSENIFKRNTDTHAAITGGTQGLGLAIAKRLVLEGCPAIAISGRNPERGEAAAEQIRSMGAKCVYIQADVSTVDDNINFINSAVEQLGGINALVNSAALTSRGSLVDTSVELWMDHLNTNARGPFLTMREFVKHCQASGKPGSIVNILSVSAYCGQSFLAAYSASKGALSILTKNVAAAHARDRIRSNGIMMGWADTPGEHVTQKTFHNASKDWVQSASAKQPMGQLVEPNQVAPLVSYLLSPESGVITGSLIHYDQIVPGAPFEGWADGGE